MLKRLLGLGELRREIDALSARLRVIEGDLASLRSRFNRAVEEGEIVLPHGITATKDRLS